MNRRSFLVAVGVLALPFQEALTKGKRKHWGNVLIIEDYTNKDIWGGTIKQEVKRWRKAGANIKYKRRTGRCPGRERGDGLPVCSVDGNGSYGYFFKYEGRRVIRLSNDLAKQNPESRLNTACHEIGHALGLNHAPFGVESCMDQWSDHYNDTITPTRWDRRHIDRKYRRGKKK